MNKGIFIRIAICVFVFCYCLYYYIDKQNQLTAQKIYLPQLIKQLHSVEEDNHRLQYEIDQFENPYHLMELARSDQFSHLQHPFIQDILTIPEGVALREKKIPSFVTMTSSSISIAVGAK